MKRLYQSGLLVIAALLATGTAPGTAAADTPSVRECGTVPEGMACIPGGSFTRGSDDGPENARPAASIWLQTFYMDINEVTSAEYEACVKAGKCPKSGPNYNDFSRPRQPINGVSWHDAVAFCESKGRRLPTEAQWEKAARGTDARLYPWGNEKATCERAVIKDRRGRSCGVKKVGRKPNTGRTFEIASKPAALYGLYDMSGNSWEWVSDWYSKSYAKCGDACTGVEPKGPCNGAKSCKGHYFKIVRGGSWYWDADHATTIYRRRHFPKNNPFHHFGFRCAASLPSSGS